MTKQITLAAEFELDAFHPTLIVPAPGEGRTLSVNFGFASGEADGDAAKADFQSFLEVVKEARFYAYRFTVAVDNTVALTEAADVTTDTTPWAGSYGLPIGVLQWLEDRSGKKWTSEFKPTNELIDYNTVTAQHLLDSASGWDGPMPELAGLTRLVNLKSAAALDAESLILVPWFDGAKPGAIEATLIEMFDTKQIDVELRNVDSGGLAGLVIRTRSLLLPQADAGSLLDESTGYLKVQPRSNEIAMALRRARERAPSLLWTLPQLISLDWNDEAVDAGHNPAPDIDDLKRAVWLGMSGLMTLFDPLLVALTMADTKREGPFLAALIALLEQLNQEDQQATFGEFDTKGLADHITQLVLSHAGQGAAPEKQSQLLASAFDLDLPKVDAFDAEEELLPVILALYAGFTPGTVDQAKFDRLRARRRFGNSFDRQVIVELGLLAKVAQDEDAVEAAALRVLTHVGVTAQWLQGLLANPTADGALDRCKDALARFSAILKDSFNGLDATRFAQGSLFEAALVAEARMLGKTDGWDDQDLHDLLLQSNWFAARLGLGAISVAPAGALTLATLAAKLPAVSLDYLDDDHEKRLHVPAAKLEDRTGTLDNALKAVVEDIFPEEVSMRFLPDPSPRDLPVQIAVDTDANDGDTFQAQYNGIGLLVRRETESWRYANLATLTPNYAQDGVAVDNPAIHPLQPVAVDDQRRLFVDYSGVPFASQVFEQTFAEDATAISTEEHTPFYAIDDPVLPLNKRLPALAYGNKYSIAAHVVSKAGVLPPDLQRSADKPWLPKDYPRLPKSPGQPIVREELYLRSTTIGRVMLTETPLPGTTPRIGVAIDGVVPLASDYPRLALTAPGATTTMLEVHRNADGTGAITLPSAAGERIDLNIADLWWWGNAGSLMLEMLNRPNALATDAGTVIGSFPAGPFAGGSIALRIESDGTNRLFFIALSHTPDAAKFLKLVKTVKIDPSAADLGGRWSAWLRLRLTGAGAGISFIDPTSDLQTKDSASRAHSDSLLMLAPGDAPEWRPELKKGVTAQLRFPQVGFVDFDRWFSNADCRALAFPARSGESMKDAEKRRRAFHQQVMTAYLGRMLDPGLAMLIDAMPDLAVSGLQLTLCAIDGLADKPSTMVTRNLAPKSEVIPFPPLGERLELASSFETHKLLKLLSSSWGANVHVACEGTTLKLEVKPVAGAKAGEIGWQVNVTVPTGVVARLSVRAIVPEGFFGEGAKQTNVFNGGIRQLAVAYADNAYLYEGPQLTIEGMLGELLPLPGNANGWIELSKKTATVEAAGKARSYNLVAGHAHNEEEAWNWRKLGSVDVQTQRWRFTGRPIYSWFDPKSGKAWPLPAGRISDNANGLDRFEAEAFFDRDVQDADIQTKQLEPAPAPTVLQSFPWDRPSATMFRHRLTLRSRYAGALLANRISTQQGYASTKRSAGETPREDWIRAAILADRTRLQLTRPQVRALMPLTISPTEGDTDAASPPVMAVFEEAPFVHGGLADRISAEVRTGFGFGFDDTPRDVVHIVDSRKEVGPDPRLTYTPTPKMTARALTLESEGPVGLTFDTPTAPAPAFANSALVLRPRLAQSVHAVAGSFEEHFLGVAFRRYLDHSWLIDDGNGQGKVASIAAPCWIEIDRAFVLSAGADNILEVTTSNAEWAATVNPRAIDPKGPDSLPMRELAIAGASFAHGLAILHLPLENGRSSLTLYALPRPTGLPGESNLPHVLVSFEWYVPDGVQEIKLSTDAAIYPTSASPVTQLNWTRTGKAFDMLEARDKAGNTLRLRATDLKVSGGKSNKPMNVINRSNLEPIHLESRLERNPLFVQRHLGVISTVKAAGVGRTIEVYHQARRVIGRDVPISLDGTSDAALRVVTFETLARPVGFNTLLTGMQRATFDLYAVIGDKYQDDETKRPGGLSFTYRPLGDTSGNSALTQLGFSLTTSQNETARFTIDIDNANRGKAVNAVHFSFVGNKIRWTCVFADGSTQTKANIAAAFSLNQAKIVEIESIDIAPENFQNAGGAINSEYWGDISMLTVPVDGEMSSFSWNWLFTGRNLEAGDAVNPARLVSIPEAEARIIAISPPIPVID